MRLAEVLDALAQYPDVLNTIHVRQLQNLVDTVLFRYEWNVPCPKRMFRRQKTDLSQVPEPSGPPELAK